MFVSGLLGFRWQIATRRASSSRRPKRRSGARCSGSCSSLTAGRCVHACVYARSLDPVSYAHDIRLAIHDIDIPIPSRQALATGRLPTFELQYVDTELPADPDETLADDGTPQPSCEYMSIRSPFWDLVAHRIPTTTATRRTVPAWKARWGKECISPVVMGTLTAQPPKYSVILELDRRIRDVPLPKYSQGAPPRGAGLSQTMSHYMPINYLHFSEWLALFPVPLVVC